MTRINALRHIAETRSMIWGKKTSALVFAAVLIVCSVTVGCSSDKPKQVSSNNPISPTQQEIPVASTPAPAIPAATRPGPKKVVHKKPATVSYSDRTFGVAFEYPRRYAIETGNAATELLASSPMPMNFVQPGGVALAAVELPETSFANTDFSSAFFNVSVHRTLSADQCTEFAVPQPRAVTSVSSSESASTTTAVSIASGSASGQPEQAPNSKLMLGDLELRSTEAVSGEGARQSDSKYFHAFQNGTCYEFGLNVTTNASEDGVMKHVDRDKVFGRLEKILATVKINPVAAPEVNAEAPAPAISPAQ